MFPKSETKIQNSKSAFGQKNNQVSSKNRLYLSKDFYWTIFKSPNCQIFKLILNANLQPTQTPN